MRRILLLTAVAVAAATLTAPAGAHIPRPDCTKRLAPRTELSCARENRRHALVVVAWARAEKAAAAKRTEFFDATERIKRAATLDRLIRSHEWLAETMRLRALEARSRAVYVFPVVRDWLTAVRVVQRAYPGSEGWLVSCSATEGSHGIWVWNGGAPASSPHHGSGAGGWMQYMGGTFQTDFDAAVADLRSRGFVVPVQARSWFSPLGQALAGGWAYGHARWPGKWTGAGC